MMGDADFDDFLDDYDDYLDDRFSPNFEMIGSEIDWVRGTPGYGSLHLKEKHGVEEHEVEEVLFELPPDVEAKRHRDFPDRTLSGAQPARGVGCSLSARTFARTANVF